MTALNMPNTIRRADLLEAVRSLGIDPTLVHSMELKPDEIVVVAFERDLEGNRVRARDEQGYFTSLKTNHTIPVL